MFLCGGVPFLAPNALYADLCPVAAHHSRDQVVSIKTPCVLIAGSFTSGLHLQIDGLLVL